LKKLQDRIRELSPALAKPIVVWLPGVRFVTERMDVPADIKSADLAAMVSLQAEQLSPFPQDSTAWGFYRPQDSPSLFLYAAWREGLQLDPSELENAELVLPDFLAACAVLPEQPCVRMFRGSGSLSALVFDTPKSLPVAIESIQLPESEESVDYEPYRAQLLGLLAKEHRNLPVEQGTLSLASYEADPEAPLQLTLHKDGKELECKLHPREILWDADVRHKDILALERKNRHLQTRLWKAMQLAGVAVLIALLLQMLSMGGQMFINAREEKLTLRQIESQSVMAKEQQLANLRSFSLTPFRPFEMLGHINDPRPERIYFDAMQATEENIEMKVKGNGPTIIVINNYRDQLAQSGHFKEVLIEDTAASSGKVDFTLNMVFNELVQREPESPISATATLPPELEGHP